MPSPKPEWDTMPSPPRRAWDTMPPPRPFEEWAEQLPSDFAEVMFLRMPSEFAEAMESLEARVSQQLDRMESTLTVVRTATCRMVALNEAATKSGPRSSAKLQQLGAKVEISFQEKDDLGEWSDKGSLPALQSGFPEMDEFVNSWAQLVSPRAGTQLLSAETACKPDTVASRVEKMAGLFDEIEEVAVAGSSEARKSRPKFCISAEDSKEVDPSSRSVLSCMAPFPVQEHKASSGVSARTLAMEMETEPKETSEVLLTTLGTELETIPRTRSSTGLSHARKFDRSKNRFQDVDEGRFRCMPRVFPTEDPKGTGPLADFVRSPSFERFSFSAIILSVCFTVYKTDHIASTLSDAAETWMRVGELTILGIFVGELVMRMMVYGGHMFMSKDGGWNLFDLIVISFASIEMILENDGGIAPEAGAMRVIRLLRVLKVLRVFRAFRFLDELRLMVSCMLGSITSLVWSSVLIMVVLLIAGLTFVQLVAQFQMDFPDKIAADTNLKNMINAHFSSVRLAMLGLFMSSTGGMDWIEVYDVVKQSGLAAAICFVLYISFFIFALVNIVTSVFVDNARKNAESDHPTLLLQKRRKDKHLSEELSGLIRQLDQESAEHNGMISWDDMQALHENDEIRDCLDMNGIDIADVDSFFFTVCKISGSDEIDIDTFVHACFRMKGGASSLDMQTALVQMHEMAMLLQKVSEQMNIQPKSGESAQISLTPSFECF